LLGHVSVKGGVGELLHARGVVGHDVLRPWEVAGGVVVAVRALEVAGDLAKVGGGARCGHGSFLHTGHGRGVVTEIFQGGVVHGVAVRHDVRLSQQGGLLQVAVGDAAVGILGGD
jgi:hypothetical protein